MDPVTLDNLVKPTLSNTVNYKQNLIRHPVTATLRNLYVFQNFEDEADLSECNVIFERDNEGIAVTRDYGGVNYTKDLVAKFHDNFFKNSYLNVKFYDGLIARTSTKHMNARGSALTWSFSNNNFVCRVRNGKTNAAMVYKVTDLKWISSFKTGYQNWLKFKKKISYIFEKDEIRVFKNIDEVFLPKLDTMYAQAKDYELTKRITFYSDYVIKQAPGAFEKFLYFVKLLEQYRKNAVHDPLTTILLKNSKAILTVLQKNNL
jgi:hypothetical protein